MDKIKKTMKNQIILIIVFGLYSNIKVCGQCNTDYLFPVNINMSKFQAINSLNLKDNICEVKNVLNYWSHPDYLKGDSVYNSQVNFKYKTHSCIKSNENVVLLNFADMKLYKMILRIWFKPEDFNKCLENYNQILESLKMEFPVYNEYIYYTDTTTKEQEGEGYWLYKSEEEKHKDKFEQGSIGYNIEYEENRSGYTKEWYKTGNIDKYLLEIIFINCKETKLDRRGY
jgi:hypothetical protein